MKHNYLAGLVSVKVGTKSYKVKDTNHNKLCLIDVLQEKLANQNLFDKFWLKKLKNIESSMAGSHH